MSTTVEGLTQTAIAALNGGYGKIVTFSHDGLPRRRVRLTLAGNCTAPYAAELHSRHSATHGKRVKPMTVEVIARCRKCAMCKKHRSDFWTARALEEYRTAYRSWFGTITLRPEAHFRFDTLAQVRLAQAGTDFWAGLTDQERFDERVKEIGVEITKWLKRLRGDRKAARRPSFRYLLIAEAHESGKTSVEMYGRPHFHVLFHETDEMRPLVYPQEFAMKQNGDLIADKYGNPFVADDAWLRSGWDHGFTRFQQAATPMAALYLCKYLTKATSARVRASGGYGGSDRRLHEQVSEASTMCDARKKITPQGEGNCVPNGLREEKHV